MKKLKTLSLMIKVDKMMSTKPQKKFNLIDKILHVHLFIDWSVLHFVSRHTKSSLVVYTFVECVGLQGFIDFVFIHYLPSKTQGSHVLETLRILTPIFFFTALLKKGKMPEKSESGIFLKGQIFTIF